MIEILSWRDDLRPAWEEYVHSRPDATIAHEPAWRDIIARTLGHRPHYLAARSNDRLVGVLPLFLTRTWWGKRLLVSIPWLDYGGVIADDSHIAGRLLTAAQELGKKLGVAYTEMRSVTPVSTDLPNRTDKVTFVMDLEAGTEALWKAFDAKLRNQVRKAEKSALETELGGVEYVNDFYRVFSVNMRDLGTPVWPRDLFVAVLEAFPKARIALVRREGQVVAGGLVLAFRDRLYVPAASAYRWARRWCPNHSLYWRLIRYGCENGFRFFDFGRSTWHSPTFKFKEQWVPQPTQLVWQYQLHRVDAVPQPAADNPRFRLLVRLWQQLPLPVANFLGPRVIRNFP